MLTQSEQVRFDELTKKEKTAVLTDAEAKELEALQAKKVKA